MTDDEFRAARSRTSSSPRPSGGTCRSRSSTGARSSRRAATRCAGDRPCGAACPRMLAKQDHEAHPRRVPQGQVADPGRCGPRLRQEQGRPPAGDRPAPRARRGRRAPVRELPLAAMSGRPGCRRVLMIVRRADRRCSRPATPAVGRCPDAGRRRPRFPRATPEPPEAASPRSPSRPRRPSPTPAAAAAPDTTAPPRARRPVPGAPGAFSPTRSARPACAGRSRCRARASSACSRRLGRGRHPRRRDPPRGRRRVHGRGPRPAHRPAGGVPRDARRRRANLAIGIHTATPDSSPMFAFIGQVERAQPRSRGVPGDRLRPSRSAGCAKWAAEPTTCRGSPRPRSRPSDQALDGRPGPVLLSLAGGPPRRAGAGDGADARPRPAAAPDPTTRSATSSSCSRGRERPVILAGAGVLRARTSNDLVRLAELLRVPVVASWRRGDVISNDHPLYLGHDRLRLAEGRSASGSPAPTRCS